MYFRMMLILSVFTTSVNRHGILEKQGRTHGIDSDYRDGLDLSQGSVRVNDKSESVWCLAM